LTVIGNGCKQAIHNKIIQHGAFTVTSHRLLLEATRN
jgi:hypothetical protein